MFQVLRECYMSFIFLCQSFSPTVLSNSALFHPHFIVTLCFTPVSLHCHIYLYCHSHTVTLCFTPMSLHCHIYLYCHSHNVTLCFTPVSLYCHIYHYCHSHNVTVCFTPVPLHCHIYHYWHSHNVTLCFTPVSLHCHIYLYSHNVTLCFTPVSLHCHIYHYWHSHNVTLCFTPVSLHCHIYLYCHSHNVTVCFTPVSLHCLIYIPLPVIVFLLFLQSHSCFIPVSLFSYSGVTIVTIISTVTMSLMFHLRVTSLSHLYSPSLSSHHKIQEALFNVGLHDNFIMLAHLSYFPTNKFKATRHKM